MRVSRDSKEIPYVNVHAPPCNSSAFAPSWRSWRETNDACAPCAFCSRDVQRECHSRFCIFGNQNGCAIVADVGYSAPFAFFQSWDDAKSFIDLRMLSETGTMWAYRGYLESFVSFDRVTVEPALAYVDDWDLDIELGPYMWSVRWKARSGDRNAVFVRLDDALAWYESLSDRGFVVNIDPPTRKH
jgi:hypothetical protein